MEAEGGIGGRGSGAAPPWAVRIRRGDGTIAGAGVLVDPQWVLTHAAAVAEGEHVTAEFVAARGASRHAVAEQVCAAEAGGVALLRLARPGPAGAASALRRLSVPHREVRVYGFPAAEGAGRWMAAATGGVAGGADGRVGLAPAGAFTAGYGGAAAVDAATGQIVGVVLPGSPDGERAGPCLSPAETIARHLPRAAGWTTGRPAVDERLHAHGPEPALFDPHFARRLAQWFRGGRQGERYADHHRDRTGRDARPPGAAGVPAAAGVSEAPSAPGAAVRTARRTDDGLQIKISRVRADDPVRAATLRRALLLADREAGGPTAGRGPGPTAGPGGTIGGPGSGRSGGTVGRPGAANGYPANGTRSQAGPAREGAVGGADTDPPVGALDLALNAAGRGTRWIAERVADRLGVLPEGLEDITGADLDATVRRVLASPATLTLVLVGVDEADDPDTLLDLLARLRVHGDRMLLVFRHDGAHVARAQSQLVIEPSQQRQARLLGTLTEITGPLADALHARMAVVLADCDRALDALIKAHVVRTTMAGTAGVAAGRGEHPDLGRFERVAARAERHMREAIARLDPLVERHEELIGRLDSYQVLYQQAVRSEDLDAEDRYQAAHDLLHARPCDLGPAEAAVREYVDFIERRGHRPPPPGGLPTPGQDRDRTPEGHQDRDEGGGGGSAGRRDGAGRQDPGARGDPGAPPGAPERPERPEPPAPFGRERRSRGPEQPDPVPPDGPDPEGGEPRP
ncbi:hypothetical protein RVR_2880 [Actinacidiphila reveromycinica]|uniref:Uncharacterized protein n=1 Tax=Actinacidiphila reveromycinica TaxID=659352 RepID=A0A7U3URB9_9ACTN|nr:hypothetical protein [Streptomyces sp. SN-593]BBA97231.1 hypothetical protein RVR_2880 [Streptomyces sp. SN-593]